MDEETRKKKKEELKRLKLKKAQKMKELEQMKSGAPVEKKSELEIAKEKLKEKKKEQEESNPDDIKNRNKLKEEMKKKLFEESLKVTNSSETYVGARPESYDEFTQCESDNEYKSDEENENVKQTHKKNYDALIVRKKRVNVENPNVKKAPIDINKIEVNIVSGLEKKEIIDKKKDELSEFVKKEKNFIEKALMERNIVNIFGKGDDEGNSSGEEEKEEVFERKSSKKINSSAIKPLCEFSDQSTRNRVVTNVEMSTNYREILLSSYSKGDEFDFNQKDGLIHLWSFALRKYPEFTFTCQSEVTSAILHPFDPNIVIGGTLSGQVFLWDIRGKSKPCSKSPFGVYSEKPVAAGAVDSRTHSSRIECLAVIGNPNSSNIVSVSEGIICKWPKDKLDRPVKVIDLKKKVISNDKEGNNEIGVLSIGYQQSECNSILIGSDDNKVYQVSLIGNEASEKPYAIFSGHEGPILSIDIHPPDKKCNFGNLFLTSSADWTTRIFSKNQKEGPLITLDTNEDYIYCAKWCPLKASVFASGDGSGHLDIWDLNYNLEEPKYRYSAGQEVVNKICWSEDAKRIIYGNNSGVVRVLSLAKEIYKSTSRDSLKFEEILNQNKKQY